MVEIIIVNYEIRLSLWRMPPTDVSSAGRSLPFGKRSRFPGFYFETFLWRSTVMSSASPNNEKLSVFFSLNENLPDCSTMSFFGCDNCVCDNVTPDITSVGSKGLRSLQLYSIFLTFINKNCRRLKFGRQRPLLYNTWYQSIARNKPAQQSALAVLWCHLQVDLRSAAWDDVEHA